MTDEEVFYVWLSQLKKRNKIKLLESYSTIQELYTDTQYDGKENDFEAAYSIARKCEKHDIRILTYDTMDVLNGINAIADKPIVLYYKGNIIKKLNTAAVVGARRCSREGKMRTLLLTEQLIQMGTTVISGMAKGIDSYAHTKALMIGGYTIAVLGCGLDICYPKEHDRLMKRISERGLLLSEYPPGTPAYSYNFPKRNRIIAALADEIHVVKAGKKSGSLITAEYGEKYGKKVYFY